MASFKVEAKIPNVSAQIRRDVQRIQKEHSRASQEAAEIASKKGQRHVQAKMRSVGLGKLANAVGQTSSKKKRRSDADGNAWGVIYARGGDESRAGGALEAYSRGVTIRPKQAEWLAVPTKAVPRFVTAGGRRRRLTPSLWEKAGLNTRIGKLVFKRIRQNLAILTVSKVSLSPKTGRAKALGKGRPRTRIVPKKDVVAFILIKQTRRAKRFDQHEIMRFYADRVPQYLKRLLAGYNRTSG